MSFNDRGLTADIYNTFDYRLVIPVRVKAREAIRDAHKALAVTIAEYARARTITRTY